MSAWAVRSAARPGSAVGDAPVVLVVSIEPVDQRRDRPRGYAPFSGFLAAVGVAVDIDRS